VLVFREQQLTHDHLLFFRRHFASLDHHLTKAQGAIRPSAIPRCTSSPACSTTRRA